MKFITRHCDGKIESIVDINTIEELKELQNKYGHSLIVDFFDDYWNNHYKEIEKIHSGWGTKNIINDNFPSIIIYDGCVE